MIMIMIMIMIMMIIIIIIIIIINFFVHKNAASNDNVQLANGTCKAR